MYNELIKEVKKMIERAGGAQDANDVLKFSESALNTANAIIAIVEVEQKGN